MIAYIISKTQQFYYNTRYFEEKIQIYSSSSNFDKNHSNALVSAVFTVFLELVIHPEICPWVHCTSSKGTWYGIHLLTSIDT